MPSWYLLPLVTPPRAVTVGNQTTINVTLVEDVTALDEIVVIGYGTQKKKELTSAISNVKSEEFNKGSGEQCCPADSGKGGRSLHLQAGW